MAAFCRQAALYTPEWNKEQAAGKMLVKLKKQLCVWLYLTFLEVKIAISTDTTLKDQCEKPI